MERVGDGIYTLETCGVFQPVVGTFEEVWGWLCHWKPDRAFLADYLKRRPTLTTKHRDEDELLED